MWSKKPKLRSSWCILLLAALLTVSTMGCGDAESGSSDVFYVYVVHGYAGGGELSVYGSSGPLATGLEFGDIGGDPNQAGQPLRVDRTRFDGQVQILLTGAMEVATISLESFAFYPGETVTLFLTRRSGPNTYDLRVMRHNQLANIPPNPRIDQSPAYNCVLNVYNGFSLSNVYTPNNFDIQLQWQLTTPPTDPGEPQPDNPNLSRLIYDGPRDANVETVCGVLTPADFSLAPQPVQDAINRAIATRGQVISQIAADAWYYMIRGQSGFLEFRVGQWIAPQGGGATVTGWRSSREYQQCVGSAVQVPVQMNTEGAVNCDRSKFNEIQVDDIRLRECNRPITYSGITISPDDASGQIFYVKSNSTTCDFKFRPRTRNVDLVFDSNGGVDSLSEFQASYPINTWQHFTLFGDPISPFAYSLNSRENVGLPTASLAAPLPKMANTGNTSGGAPVPTQ